MTTRRRNENAPSLADLEAASNPVDVPGITPPPGVEANVETRVRYTRMVDPEASDYSNDLRELAASEIDDDDIPEPNPQDPYSDFVNTWRKYHGYPLKIVRLPDPATRLIPGQTYNRVCREIEMLSDTPFDPSNLINILQVVNGNSGGVFRVFLTDEYGRPIPGARLDRLVVADPPKQYNNQRSNNDPDDFDRRRFERDYQRRYERDTAPPAPPVKSDMELHIENMQRQLFEKVMLRALDPPIPPPIDPLSTIPEGDRLALSLLRQGDLLPTLVDRISSLAQAPDRIESATWKDKLAEAGIQLVTHNPQIVATVTDIISRATVAVASAFAPRNQQFISEPVPVHAPPAQRAAPQMYPAPQQPPQQAVNTGLPEAPEPEDEDDMEDAEIDMMEDIIKLLLSDKPLDLNDPVITGLREDYPAIFERAMQGIAVMPPMVIIQYLCSKSDFCADMFNSPRNGPHLKARLTELKSLIKNSDLLPPQVKEQLAQQENNTEAQNANAPAPE